MSGDMAMSDQTFAISRRRLADIRLAFGVQVALAVAFVVAAWRVARPGHPWPSVALGFAALAATLASIRSNRLHSSARRGELDILICSASVRVSPRLTLKKGELGKVTSKGLRRDAPGTLFLELQSASLGTSRTVRIDARAYEGGEKLRSALAEWASVGR